LRNNMSERHISPTREYDLEIAASARDAIDSSDFICRKIKGQYVFWSSDCAYLTVWL
jgi:hypothetical protein